MALNLATLTAFIGRITAADSNYPYGSSKSETTSGAGDGTPYIKVRADDIFGFQQAMLTEAGIVPSGSADTALNSQYLESLRVILNARTTTHNIASDADYILTTTQNKYNRFVITDTGVLLTTTRSVIVSTAQKRFLVQNNTAQSLIFKTSAGTGITVLTGAKADLYCDGTNVILATNSTVVSDASETTKGIIELATNAEARAGTDTLRAITPASMKSASFGQGQTCVDLTGSRLTGTSYVNSSGKTKFIMVEATSAGGGAQLTPQSSGGVTLPSNGGGSVAKASVWFPVENEASYAVTLNLGTMTRWVEFG